MSPACPLEPPEPCRGCAQAIRAGEVLPTARGGKLACLLLPSPLLLLSPSAQKPHGLAFSSVKTEANIRVSPAQRSRADGPECGSEVWDSRHPQTSLPVCPKSHCRGGVPLHSVFPEAGGFLQGRCSLSVFPTRAWLQAGAGSHSKKWSLSGAMEQDSGNAAGPAPPEDLGSPELHTWPSTLPV